jgi:hypothetical protein
MQINRKVILILGSSLISIGGVFFITSCSKKVYHDSRIIHKFDGSDWFNFKSGDVVNITLEKDNHNSLDGYFTINKNSN